MRARDRQYRGMCFFYQIFFKTQAPRNDDLAILSERFADGAEGFLDRGVDEAAGVDDDEVGAGVVGRGDVTLGPELGEDSFGIYECFRAA
jgi:hypothetical protein